MENMDIDGFRHTKLKRLKTTQKLLMAYTKSHTQTVKILALIRYG